MAVSRGAADDLIRTAGVPARLVRVIYNPVITLQLKSLAAEPVDHPWFAAGQPAVVLGIGRLTQQKQFAVLIGAFAVLRQNVDCRLAILGEGEDRNALEGLVRDLGLTESVALLGFVKNPFSYLLRSSLFVLSSAWEALPTVLIESLWLGVPVVATDCPSGPDEILHGGRYGKLAPPGDVEALARAMQDALGAERCTVPESIFKPFSIEVAVNEYIRLIGEITHA